MDIPDSTYYSYSRIGQPEDDGILVSLRRDVRELLFKRVKNPFSIRTFGLLLGSKIKRDDGFIVHIDDIYPLGRLKPGREPRALTPNKWEKLQNKMYNYFPDKEIVGWYGIRNGWSAMLTEEDQRVHRDFFTKSWHVLYLLDGTNEMSSLFYWEGDRLIRSGGCYLYWDKNHGAQRVFTNENMSSTKEMSPTKKVPSTKRIPAIGAAAIIILIISLGTFNGWWDPLLSSTYSNPKDNTQLGTDKIKGSDEERMAELLKGLTEEEEQNGQGSEKGPSKGEEQPKDSPVDGKKGKGKPGNEVPGEKEPDEKAASNPPRKDVITGDAEDYKDRIAELEKEIAKRDRKIESLEKDKETEEAGVNGSSLYIIEKGDNLYNISQKFYGTDRYGPVLAKINRIRDQKSLMIGSYIVIPPEYEIEDMVK